MLDRGIFKHWSMASPDYKMLPSDNTDENLANAEKSNARSGKLTSGSDIYIHLVVFYYTILGVSA